MNQLDVYYRALLNYRQLTATDNDCNSLRAAIVESNTEQDKIVIFEGDASLEGAFVDLEITRADTFNLYGKIKK